MDSMSSETDYLYRCGICNSADCDENSWQYCNQCRAYLCLVCCKDHLTLSDLKKHTVMSGPIILRNPIAKQAPSGLTMFDKVLDLEVATLDKVNIKLSDKHEPVISGSTFLSNGELLLCDKSGKIILLDVFFEMKNSLKVSAAYDISVSTGPLVTFGDPPENTAIVTIPSKNTLQYIYLKPKLYTSSVSVILDKCCYGIHVVDKKIYVSCYDRQGKHDGEVRILNLYGSEEKRFYTFFDDIILLKEPFYISVSSDGNFIYVSDMNTGTLTCFDIAGNIIYQYNGGLKNPRGIFIDTKGNSIICNEGKNTVEVITATGMHHGTLVSNQNHGIRKPKTVSFRPYDGTLVVGSDELELSVFNLRPKEKPKSP